MLQLIKLRILIVRPNRQNTVMADDDSAQHTCVGKKPRELRSERCYKKRKLLKSDLKRSALCIHPALKRSDLFHIGANNVNIAIYAPNYHKHHVDFIPSIIC